MQTFLTRLRRHRLAQRLRYEAIYSWPGWRHCAAFNGGYFPPDPDIAADPDFSAEPNQIALYAELIKTSGLGATELRAARVLELAAGRGGGLFYLQKRFAPAELIGMDISSAAVRHGRRRGLDLRQGSAHRLPFAAGRFDLVLALDALVHLIDRDAVLREARRVLAPGGLLLTGDFIKAPAADALAEMRVLAESHGFRVEKLRDITANVVASLERDHARKAALLQTVPFFIRPLLTETLALPGSARYREWQRGERGYCLAALQR
jgi:ubiquinone/menaquinone biosynthesis C-methylase UbiE